MGTSQGLTLKTTPQWSSAKRAMTGLLNDFENEAKLENFMQKFYQALGNDGIFTGTTTSGGSAAEPIHEATAEVAPHHTEAAEEDQKDDVRLEEPGPLPQLICWASFLTLETTACRKPLSLPTLSELRSLNHQET